MTATPIPAESTDAGVAGQTIKVLSMIYGDDRNVREETYSVAIYHRGPSITGMPAIGVAIVLNDATRWLRPFDCVAGAEAAHAGTNSVWIMGSSARLTPNVSIVGEEDIIRFGDVKVSLQPDTGLAGCLLPAMIAPGITTSTAPYQSTRNTACSALFTNVTKALDKEGTVIAGRFSPQVTRVFDVDSTSFSTLHPSEKYFFGLEKGFYTYLALSTDNTQFRDEWVNDPGWSGPVIPLDQTAMVNTFLFSDPDGGTALAINLDWHIEYRNTSVLWPIGVSAISLDEAQKCQLALLSAGFFFDNTHHNSVLNWVTKGVKALKPYGSLHPVLGVGLHGADKMLSAFAGTRKKGPQPTKLNVEASPTQAKPKGKGKNRKAKPAPRSQSRGRSRSRSTRAK
jgi:hypothetical protein